MIHARRAFVKYNEAMEQPKRPPGVNTMDTLTIDLTPEMNARLAEIAEERRQPVPECARELPAEAIRVHDRETVPVVEDEGVNRVPAGDRAARLAAIDRAAGSLAYLGGSVDAFLREKHEEARHEEELDRQRQAVRSADDAAS